MVIGHASCPKAMYQFIYSFHMPLFFIASGYFFSAKSLDDKVRFVIKKVKGIYLPYVICSLLFLVAHNYIFSLGLLNDVYGNRSGVVDHLYTTREIISRAAHIVTLTGGWDAFLLGAYWFMRTLFISSLILCFGAWVLNKVLKSADKSIYVLAVICLIIAVVMQFTGFEVPYYGGYREMMGVFFMAVGYGMRKFIAQLNESGIAIIVATVGVVVLFFIHPASLEQNSTFIDTCLVPFSGAFGTYVIYRISRKWGQCGHCSAIAYIGQKSFWILTFHHLAFKVSEFAEIAYYDLPPEMIGCHSSIPAQDNWFFLIHTVTAVSLCTLLAFLFSKVKGVFARRA